MIVYIAGKTISKDGKKTESNFSLLERRLREEGFEVINPFKLIIDDKRDWAKVMKGRIAELMKADVVYIHDYLNSYEITIERSIALNIGMPLFYSFDQLVNYSRIVRKCEEL